MKKIKLIGLLSLVALFAITLDSCTDEEKFPIPFNSTNGEIPGTLKRGAYLKTLALDFIVDFTNLDGSQFSITLEEHDELNDGSLIQDVDVYLSYIDRNFDNNGTPDDISDDIDNSSKTEVLFDNIPASAFTENAAGFFETSYGSSVRNMITTLGLTDPEIAPLDIFQVRYVLNLTNGDSYTDANANINISGEDAFNSPFIYQGGVTCVFDEPDFFTGEYTIATTDGGAFGAVFDGPITLVVDEDDTTKRTFEGDWNGFGLVRPYGFSMICGDIVWDDGQSTGLACGGGAAITLDTPDTFTQYDLNFIVDDVIVINIFEQTTSCGGPAKEPVVVTLTKV